jgi:hypothetical protein
MFSMDSTFSLRFLIILILSVYMIWDQTTKVLIQTATLKAPGLYDTWIIQGLNNSGHQVTPIRGCSGAWTCGQQICQFYQNPSVETILSIPPSEPPHGPCGYPLSQAFNDVWSFPAGVIAMCSLGVASLFLGLWMVCLWWQPYLAWILYCVSRVCLIGGIMAVGWMVWSGDAHKWVWSLEISVQVIMGVVCILELISTLQVLYVMWTCRSIQT